MKKGNRFERICPICGKENLKYLSDHLSSVHKLSSLERKPYLALAKYQGITAYNINVYNAEPSIPKIKCGAAKGKNRTVKSNVKQAVKRKPLQVKNSWTSYQYPNFWFKHPFSLMIVGPTSCGKTLFVRQLLESKRMKDFNIEWHYNQRVICHLLGTPSRIAPVRILPSTTH